ADRHRPAYRGEVSRADGHPAVVQAQAGLLRHPAAMPPPPSGPAPQAPRDREGVVMQITVTFRHVEPTPALRAYAEEKLERVKKYLRRPVDAHVILSVAKERHVAEITLQADHVTMFAKEETHDLYSAIDLALDTLEHQAQKLKAKRRDHTGPSGNRGGDEADVIQEMAGVLTRDHTEIDRQRLIQALEDRERLNSTALGDGVAIPHGKLPGLKRVLAAFGRSRAGVDFQSLDGKPTHLFFLLVAPEDSAGAHLKALARISRLLKDEGFRARLMEASSAHDLFETIRTEDDRY